jgi:hypothetical protein
MAGARSGILLRQSSKQLSTWLEGPSPAFAETLPGEATKQDSVIGESPAFRIFDGFRS